ncbi:MAG TPA: GYF domain-containing protein [Verrucomicrobiae bacterium]|jgi:TM2 domain-containing membrane protein YozV|nr:GYF domain-containing protein [Verrucomicrobiae bacterium]
MYKIIGADGQPYGPATLQQMRQWIAENRVRAETLGQAEGSSEWKPLASFPELAAEFRTSPPPIAATLTAPPTISNPRASNKIPAGVCGIILGALGVHKFILGYTGAGIIMLMVTVVSCGTLYPIMHLIGLIEGIIYVTKTDDEFVRTYVDGKKAWF